MTTEPPFGNRQSRPELVEGSRPELVGGSAIAPGPYVGPSLTPWQYEALCRHALSREYGIPLADIKTGYLESPSKTRHQIDLYWHSRDSVCNFLCFANAKFQKVNIDLADIMLLLGVQRDIRAHKAMLITNTGFSHTAISLARENGIALLIVRPAPDFDVAVLPQAAAPVVAQTLEKIAPGLPSVYRLNIVHRGFDPNSAFSTQPSTFSPPPVPQSAISNPHSAIPPPPVPQSAFSNHHSAIPNKMLASPANPPRAPGPFGIRRK